MSAPSFNFRQTAADASNGLYVKPILQNYLFNATWPDFSLYFPAKRTQRRPDGYFHPSTHPMWTERQLYLYLTQPDRLLPEDMEYMGTLSVTVGTAMHGFVQMCLLPSQANILVPPPKGNCPACGRETSPMPVKGKCWEHGIVHEETKTRGHMDGLLNIPEWGLGGWEFKTSNAMTLGKLQDNDVEAYRKKWPHYYGQNQDYMRASGLRQMMVLFMSMGYPWTMKEFHVPYDHAYGAEIDQKYRSVLAHVAAGKMPEPCCAPRSKTAQACFARNVCPVGLA